MSLQTFSILAIKVEVRQVALAGELMTENRNINTGGGRYIENKGIYYENHQQAQTLAEAAAEIQKLLEQLDKIYSTDTTMGKMAIASEAIQLINSNPTLAQRILSALQAGSVSALESFLNHPAASFVIAALQDWQQNQPSQEIR